MDVWLLDVEREVWSEVGMFITLSNQKSTNRQTAQANLVCTHREIQIVGKCVYYV